MGSYDPIPKQPSAQAISDLRALGRRQADTTAGQLYNTRGRLGEAVDFLLDQSHVAERSGTSVSFNYDPITEAVPRTWVPYDGSGADAWVELTTSSTGKVAYTCGGLIALTSKNGGYICGYIGLEVLQLVGGGWSVVRSPLNGDGNYANMQNHGDSYLVTASAGSGHTHVLSLSPATRYWFRCRRGYDAHPREGESNGTSYVRFQGTSLSVMKLGM